MGELPGYKALPKNSKRIYTSTWLSFVYKYNITVEKPPTEKQVCDFLKAKVVGGRESTARVNY